MISNRTVAFHTLGCKLNFAETSAIGRELKNAGYEKVEMEAGADVVVINTCSVTENADKECRSIVRRALSYNPESYVAIIGCYAQLRPEEISKIEGVDLVLGASEKFNLPQYLENISKAGQAEIHSCDIHSITTFNAAYSAGDRTRAFLKVQDGCDYSCTYCTIPLARGSSRSDSIPNIVKMADEIGQKGIREIVLTGVNIGDYGIETIHEKRKNDFLDLIKQLDKVGSISRYRISSIEPNLLKDEIIDFVAQSEKFTPHFHIPLQSGSNKILGLMKRRYKRELYQERVAKIKSLMPDCAIGVDVIVGFPGETEEDFLDTYNFINSLDITYLHVFTYSERPDTEAITFNGIVPQAERKRRNKMLRILSEKKRQAFYRNFIGRKFYAMLEHEINNGMLEGYTSNYIRVSIPFDEELQGKLIEVEITGYNGEATAMAQPIAVLC